VTEPRGDGSELRRAGYTALIALALLNIADVTITELAINRGASELNPVGQVLMESHLAIVVKLGIVLLLAADFHLRRPRLITLCGLWMVVGIYVMVVIINGVQLASLG
jgi:hypothetical protein